MKIVKIKEGEIGMTKNMTVKRDTSGFNRKIRVQKGYNSNKIKGIPAPLWNYEWYEYYGYTNFDCFLNEVRCGTTVVTKNELVRAVDNNMHWPGIIINDGFSTRSWYGLFDSNDRAIYNAIHNNDLVSLPDALYRITFWYNSIIDEEWADPMVQVDIIR